MSRRLHCIRSRAALLVLALVAVAQPASAGAATIHVDSASNAAPATCGTSTDPCESIADAVARAAIGDELRLAPGDYTGATIDRAVRILGPQSGVTGVARGLDGAARTATVRGTLVIQAPVTIDGLEFRATAGPALRFAAPLPGAGTGASLVANSTFAKVAGAQVVYVDGDVDALTLNDNLFASEPGKAHVGVFVHGELVTGGIGGVVVERNEFRGFAGHAEAAAIDAGGVPGLRVRANTVVDSGPLLVLSDTDGSADRVLVQDNIGSGFIGHAVRIGRGVVGIAIERNRISGTTGAALRLAGERGTGQSSDITFRANDVSAVRTAVSADGDLLDGALVVRGNRLIALAQQNVIVNSLTSGTIDARRNWWGRSTGLPASAVNGDADIAEPLRLVGVDAPAAVLVNGSGVVSVRLVGPIGGSPEADAAGFPVTFATSNATLDAATVTVGFGTASTLFTAGDTPGATTTTATLDGESVSATTKILPAGSVLPAGPAEPSVAESRGPGIASFRASIARSGRLVHALSAGFSQRIETNRPASVRTTYLVSHFTAKLLGLRPRRSTTHEPFVIAKVRTRAIQGRRIVRAEIRKRPRFAIARYEGRIEVIEVTHVRALDGSVRSSHRRIVIPANVR